MTIRQYNGASDIISDKTGNMRLLDALFRRKIPVGLDAPDADAPDAFYFTDTLGQTTPDCIT